MLPTAGDAQKLLSQVTAENDDLKQRLLSSDESLFELQQVWVVHHHYHHYRNHHRHHRRHYPLYHHDYFYYHHHHHQNIYIYIHRRVK
jgi:hypothetical protein